MLSNIDETKLSEEALQFLKKDLGDLGYIYEKDKTAALFKSDPSLDIEFNKYKLISATENTVTISSLSGPEVKLTFEGNCYLVDSGLELKEYFCKE